MNEYRVKRKVHLSRGYVPLYSHMFLICRVLPFSNLLYFEWPSIFFNLSLWWTVQL